MNEEVKVGNFTKPIKRPVPKTAGAPVREEAPDVSVGGDAGIADLNKKMDKLLEFAQAIDWKLWVYLKANNYIE
jgi:hypothetical protein